MQKVINSAIYFGVLTAAGFSLFYFPHDYYVTIVFMLISVILQYILLSSFSSSVVWLRITLTAFFLLLGSSAAVMTLTTVAFNDTVSDVELLAPLVFPGTIITLHLLWKPIIDAGKKIIDPHKRGIS